MVARQSPTQTTFSLSLSGGRASFSRAGGVAADSRPTPLPGPRGGWRGLGRACTESPRELDALSPARRPLALLSSWP